MGLDVLVQTDNEERLYREQPDDYLKQYSLSRTFCNLLMRPYALDGGGEPELTQLGRLTGVDIAPLEQMQTHPEELGLEYWLGTAGSETEKQAILAQAEAEKVALAGNLPLVLATVRQLLERLATIENLPALLDPHNKDTLGYEHYFTDFLTDKGDGYIRNNFGQDLRNLQRFLKFAQSRECTTVWFSFG